MGHNNCSILCTHKLMTLLISDTECTPSPIPKRRKRAYNRIESDSEDVDIRNRTPSPDRDLDSSETSACSNPFEPSPQVHEDATPEPCRQPPRHSTPCTPSPWSGSSGSVHIIEFEHQGDASPWDSQDDTGILETSTPPYRRGQHSSQMEHSDEQVRQLIRMHGLQAHRIPRHLSRKCPVSIQLFADHHLKQWPFGDIQCHISYMEHLPLSQWVEKIKRRELIIRAGTIVLYLQKLRNITHPVPLKNQIGQICRSIRAASMETRIFICDTLPENGGPVNDDQLIRYNRSLFLATQHVNRELEKIFFLAMHAHFVDSNGQIIQPVHKYFSPGGYLTYLGCITFRACMAREVGITNYSL